MRLHLAGLMTFMARQTDMRIPRWRGRREQYLREVGSSADLTYFTSNPHISGDGMSAVDNIVG